MVRLRCHSQLASLRTGDKVRFWPHEWDIKGNKRTLDMVVEHSLEADLVGFNADGSYMLGGPWEHHRVTLGMGTPGSYSKTVSAAGMQYGGWTIEMLSDSCTQDLTNG
jgi:hypothetical protein